MKKLIITTFILGSLFCATTAHAQIDIKFSPTTDLSQFIYTGTTDGVLENKKLLKVAVLDGKNWSNIVYQPVGGVSLGSDNFIVIKSSKAKYSFKVRTDADVHAYSDGKSFKCADGEFYIHTYKVSELKPANSFTSGVHCKNVQLGTNGVMGGDVVLLEWVKSFPDEASAIEYVKKMEKVDAKF